MATAELKNGKATDIGPVSEVTFPIPEGGGVVLFRGSNGSGKTTMLNAIDTSLGTKKPLTPRDRTTAGRFEGLGMTLNVRKSISRKGELEVTALDSKLPVSALVDPGMKDEDAADRVRIKALIQLTGVDPEPKIFHELFGGQDQFERLCAPKPNEDIVSLAARAKRSLEEEARREEGYAETQDGKALACKTSAGEIDLTGESDAVLLQNAHSEAITRHEKLKSQAEEAQRAAGDVQKARAKIEEAKETYDGPTAEEAATARHKAEEAEKESLSKVEAARLALQAAEKDHAEKRNALAASISAEKSAAQHERLLAQWTEQLESQVTEAPSDIELADAAAQVAATREAIEQGAMIRKAKEHLAQAEKHNEEAANHRKKGISLREAAKSIDDILSDLVAGTNSGLSVKAGRLVLQTPKRGETYFAELSHGERYKIGIDITADAVGRNGAFTIPQEAWEGLDPINRRAVCQHAKERGVLIFSAVADEGGLRAEVYGD